jgi:hypothetical protein
MESWLIYGHGHGSGKPLFVESGLVPFAGPGGSPCAMQNFEKNLARYWLGAVSCHFWEARKAFFAS